MPGSGLKGILETQYGASLRELMDASGFQGGDRTIRGDDLALHRMEQLTRAVYALESKLDRLTGDEEIIPCVDCDQPIDVRRLLAVPGTQRCVRCQRHVDPKDRQREPPRLLGNA